MRLSFFALLLASCLLLASSARADNKRLIVQTTPSDCGPAALATLLTHYLGVSATEKEIEKSAGTTLTLGTTLLGLEKAAVAKGCAADSFRMTYAILQEQLNSFPAPVIVNLLNQEPHFAVVLEADEQFVYLADPALGNIVLRKKEFLKYWARTNIPLPAGQASEKNTDAKGNQETKSKKPSPEEMEGFVFIVAGPNEEAGLKERRETVNRLRQQMENLQRARPPVALRIY